MLDCAKREAVNVSQDYGNWGCQGGWIKNYSDFVITEGVIPYDNYLPYADTEKVCEHDPAKVVANATSAGQIVTSIEDAIT